MGTKRRPMLQPFPVKSVLKTWSLRKSDGKLLSSTTTPMDWGPTLKQYLQGTQVTESVSHPDWRRAVKGDYNGDVGGPFFSQKRYVESINTAPVVLFHSEEPVGSVSRDFALWEGVMLPLAPSQIVWPTSVHSSGDALDELGSTAISRCSPTNTTADVSVMLGELLKDGIPSVLMGTLNAWKGLTNRQRRRAIASEYLSFEFAWKPLVNDLRKLASAVTRADEVIRQHERDSGRMVRRRYEFPEETSTTSTVVMDPAGPWASPMSNILHRRGTFPYGKVVRTDTVVRRKWFSGAFTYYVPPLDGSLRTEIARAVIFSKKLLGVTLTPDTLWELSPWSWAVDWFSNTGDVINNFSNWAIDNQVLLYGYMMETTICKRTYTFVGNTGLIPEYARPADVTLVIETKQRRQATPFGFGTDWSGLTSRQQAIAAALAMSKS